MTDHTTEQYQRVLISRLEVELKLARSQIRGLLTELDELKETNTALREQAR